MKMRCTSVVLVLCVSAVSALAVTSHAATQPRKAQKKTQPEPPKELTGTVSRIVDGDTLWLKTAPDAEPMVIRLEGIDAPESCQAGGADATQALTKLALNRNVTVRIVARDDFARIVGKVFDGTVDVGDRMVRDGHAWSMRFKYDRGPYVAEERMATALKRGVHAERGAVMPREFRQQHGPCEGTAVAAKPVASTVPVVTPASTTTATAAAGSGTTTSYRCDGRKSCSQMTSCQEATWFLKNCPRVKVDGNNDGVPCEKQWCR